MKICRGGNLEVMGLKFRSEDFKVWQILETPRYMIQTWDDGIVCLGSATGMHWHSSKTGLSP